jgi:hypothetical protein
MNRKNTKGRGTARNGGMPHGDRSRPRRRNGSTLPPEAPPAGEEPATRPTTGEPKTPTHRPKLTVEVVWADITQAKGDVYFVGHYMGVPPQKGELALDRAVSGAEDRSRKTLLITEWTRRGLLRGALGEVVFFPWDPRGVVAVAGMGRPGTFHKPQLKILARSIARSVGLLPRRSTIATLLIGSGPGNLAVRDAAIGLVEGIAEELNEDPSLEIGKLSIVEQYLDRSMEILDALSELRRKDYLGLDIKPALADEGGGEISPEFGCSLLLASLADFTEGPRDSGVAPMLDQLLAMLPDKGRLPDRVRAKLDEVKEKCKGWEGIERLRRLAMCFRLREEADPVSDKAAIPSRVSFWADGQDIHAAAITNTVTVTERQIAGRMPLVERAIERLINPPKDELKESAEVLYRLLVPSDVKDILRRQDSLVVEVDGKLARVQWEMLPTESDGRPLGVARSIARQLRTLYSPRLDETHSRRRLKALVVGDPGDPALGHGLEHAQQEALEVSKLLKNHGVETKVLIGAPEDGTNAGPLYAENIPPADYFEVVQLLLSGRFDIIHYCGHAQFYLHTPERAGWVFKGGLLTARELEGLERPPSLVVANACVTAQLSQSTTPVASDRPADLGRKHGTRLVASLAEEFFRRGVSDYIGTAWEVPSGPAAMFATSFYNGLLNETEKHSIGEALRLARKKLYEQQDDFGESASVWAAYQHYGDPTRVLTVEAAEDGPPGR